MWTFLENILFKSLLCWLKKVNNLQKFNLGTKNASHDKKVDDYFSSGKIIHQLAVLPVKIFCFSGVLFFPTQSFIGIKKIVGCKCRWLNINMCKDFVTRRGSRYFFLSEIFHKGGEKWGKGCIKTMRKFCRKRLKSTNYEVKRRKCCRY